MLRNKLIGLFIIALIVVSVCAAVAADTAKPWSVAAGIFRPTDSDLRDFAGSSWLTVRLGYDIPSKLDKFSQQIEVGYTYKKKHDVKFQEIPLTWNFLAKSADEKFFYGAGVGAYFIKVTGVDSKTKFGVPLIVGYNITQDVNLQLRYDWITSKVEGTNLGGFDLMIGTKF